jgi:hypothetical protein
VAGQLPGLREIGDAERIDGVRKRSRDRGRQVVTDRLAADDGTGGLWWGSELGFWVWLILAWALWLGLLGASRPALRSLLRRLDPRTPALRSRPRLVATILASTASLAGLVAVGSAVAATGKRDSHAYEYRSVRKASAGVERLIPSGQTLRIHTGGLDIGTQPMEPTMRFFLVRHGDRGLSNGALPRLGPYYELYNRPVQWTVYLVNGTHPQRNRTLAARVRFTSPWGNEILSVWVRKVTARPAKAARTLTRSRPGRPAGPTTH